MSVGVNLTNLTFSAKKEAYNCDILYTTNSELGFDYLRDNMVKNHDHKVQRELNFAIIDEADSILIDEARTPLIISGGRKNRASFYNDVNAFAHELKIEDYQINEETRQIFLTTSGIAKAQQHFNLNNLFAIENSELFHNLQNALKAVFVFKRDVEYVVKNNEIVLIDQFTGRLMPGRVYSDGLHQALQAKEKLPIQTETSTVATITYQNYFRLYNKLSGMTGTAKSEEEEFIKVYNIRVVTIPTNLPMIRYDDHDYVYATLHAKFKGLLQEVLTRHEKGQPILIVTTNVDVSEKIANLLSHAGITKFNILNAKNHSQEADIIKFAGEKGTITIATNMAGRGTDIKLGEGVKELGGLAVLLAEHNESIRIDNQARGRSGRQGDPGYSKCFVSLEDELLIRFGQARLKKMFSHLGEDYIRSRLLTRAIKKAQLRIQGMNFDVRKNVLDYDNVIALHREAIYQQRDKILVTTDTSILLQRMFTGFCNYIIKEVSIMENHS
jgi:preprotein translocase subunit SecA